MFEFLKYKSLPALLSVMLVAPVLCDLHGQMRESFNHLSVNEGLSQSTIYAITQDSKGFLWFGTRGGGLNRYDGYEFKVFRNNQDMPGSLSDDEVTSILEDSHGTLWIGTRNGGLNRYDLSSGKFTRYLSGEGKEDELKGSGTVRCIYEDRAGRLWVGMNHKVCLYERNEDRFDPILNDAPIPVKGTTGICEDSEGRLYFATWDRLIQYDTESNTFNELYIPEDPFSEFGGRITPVLMDRNDRLWLGTPAGLKIVNVTESFQYADASIPGLDWPESFSYIRTITEAKDGMIWFGTGQGLYALDPDQGMLKSYHTEANNPLSLVHNSVYSVFEDMVGTLWIGTWSGISVLDKRKYNFTHFSHMYNDPRSLSNNLVSSFQEDRLGTWIGTEQGGLNFMNKERTNFVAFQYSEDDPQSLPTNNVKSIFLDSNQDLWVGTFRGGLSLHLGAGKFKHFLTGHSVFDISEMPEGTLWIGCSTGLYTMNLKSREIKREVFPPSVGSRALESFITVLHPDLDKRMWIGTKYDGLYLFDSHRASLKHFKSVGADSTSLSGDYVISICESPSTGIWIGTNSGLNRYRETSMSFERFRSRIGIEDNVINGLLPDHQGRLWISTNTGIYLYNADSGGGLRHYDYLDGLQSNEFNRGALTL